MNVEQHETKDLVYLLITPDDYDQTKQYPMVVLLHGFGASMQDLAAITPMIGRNDYIYVCPNAPIEIDVGPGLPGYSMTGYSWVPPRGEATEEDIQTTTQTLQRFFSEIVASPNETFSGTDDLINFHTFSLVWDTGFLKVLPLVFILVG